MSSVQEHAGHRLQSRQCVRAAFQFLSPLVCCEQRATTAKQTAELRCAFCCQMDTSHIKAHRTRSELASHRAPAHRWKTSPTMAPQFLAIWQKILCCVMPPANLRVPLMTSVHGKACPNLAPTTGSLAIHSFIPTMPLGAHTQSPATAR